MLDTNMIQLLSRSMDAASLRQRIIADNIANVDTPNYKSKGVSFEQELQDALDDSSTFEGTRTDPRHIPIGGKRLLDVNPTIYTNPGVMQNNGNNVDIDTEMTNMAKNQIWYNALVQQTNQYYQTMQKVISGGK